MDRSYVERIIDRSLQRLGVERLDLVQYYWWRDEVEGFERTAQWLADIQTAGKIRHVAATNLDAEHTLKLIEAGVTPVTNQVQYSLLDRRPEGRLVEACASTGMRLLAFGTIAGGFLSRRWLGVEESTTPTNRSLVKYRLIIEEFGGWNAYQALLSELTEIADEYGVEPSSVAVRFVLDQPEVAAVIVGSTRLGQMARNVDAFSFSLTRGDHRRLRALTESAPGPAGPVFGLERQRDGPHGRLMKYDLNRAQ